MCVVVSAEAAPAEAWPRAGYPRGWLGWGVGLPLLCGRRAHVLTEIEDGCGEWASRLHGSSYMEKLRWIGGTIGPAPRRAAAARV